MDNDEIKQEVLNIIQGMVIAETVSEDDVLRELGIDSLKMVNLMIGLEDGLNIRIDDSDLDVGGLNTVADIVALAEKGVGNGKL